MFYTGQIGDLRGGEIKTIKKLAVARSALVAMMMFAPLLASISSFVSHFIISHQFGFTVRRAQKLCYRSPML